MDAGDLELPADPATGVTDLPEQKSEITEERPAERAEQSPVTQSQGEAEGEASPDVEPRKEEPTEGHEPKLRTLPRLIQPIQTLKMILLRHRSQQAPKVIRSPEICCQGLRRHLVITPVTSRRYNGWICNQDTPSLSPNNPPHTRARDAL